MDQPQLDYHHPTLSSVGYDMEGYAFMRAAKQFADAEDIGLYKVVLDSPRDPIPAKPAKIITKLIATHVDTLCEEIRYRKQLAAQRCDRQSPPPILHSLLSRLRPTVSQNHRLRTLVLRYRALCPDTPLPEHVLECKNATDGIRALEAELLALHDPYGTLDSWELNSSSKRDEIP